MIQWMKTPEAQEAFGSAAKVNFPEKQRVWFKETLEKNQDVRLPARTSLGQPLGRFQGDRRRHPGSGLLRKKRVKDVTHMLKYPEMPRVGNECGTAIRNLLSHISAARRRHGGV